MPFTPEFREVESQVYSPGRWLFVSAGALFVVLGLGFFSLAGAAPRDSQPWIRLGTGVFAAFGGLALSLGIAKVVSPAYVRHAASDVLPHVPREPVIVEGSVVHGRLTHELIEDADGWQFRPAPQLWRDDKRFLLGFGIPFCTLFAGVLSWIIHTEHNLAWPLAVLCGASVTTFVGGTVFGLMGMLMRSGYRRLSLLRIPRNGGNLEVDSPEPPNPGADLPAGMNWFHGETERQRLAIPPEMLQAVQLCPWKYVGSSEITWAVQGLLVLRRPDDDACQRLPLLLTNDFVGAARLMQQLAAVLHVPYLFCADADGWKAEQARAKKRQPLRVGGTQS